MQKIIIVTLLSLISFVGCSATKPPKPTALAAVRPEVDGITVEERVVSRAAYLHALQSVKNSDSVRIVEIFQKAAAESQSILKEYRLFDVNDNSAYALLGLRTADILVGAHGFVISSPLAFRTYLIALAQEQSSFIEIRRAGMPLMLKFQFE